MRLFTGIAIPSNVLDNLERVLDELRPLAPLKWSPVENLHITTKFIGQYSEQRLPELKQALAELVPPPEFAITLARFGYFPNPHHPKTFFAGVQAGAALAELATKIENALVPLGVPREDRTYSPHLTLARIKNENIRELREHIAKMTTFDFGTFQASEFHLYLSEPAPRGSVYTRLASCPLSATVNSQAGSQAGSQE
jgi:2'-5' RNA ligase